MSAINSHILDFITDGGGELGYDTDNLPPLSSMEEILEKKIKSSVYFKKEKSNDIQSK